MLPAKEKAQVTFVKHTQGKYVGKLHIPVAGGEYRRLLSYDFEPQHLYILSDDEIKEGDWFITFCSDGSASDICNATKLTDKGMYDQMTDNYYTALKESGHKKIIATTDEILGWHETAKYHIDFPQPSQEFIQHYVEEYNKGNVITEIMVKYEVKAYADNLVPEIWDELKINPDNTINIKPVKDSWSREEVIEIAKRYAKRCQAPMIDSKWFEENL